jgi:hypothetical protein
MYNNWITSDTWKNKIFERWGDNFSLFGFFIGEGKENVRTANLTDFIVPEPENLLMAFLLCLVSNSDGWAIVSK